MIEIMTDAASRVGRHQDVEQFLPALADGTKHPRCSRLPE